MVGQERAGETTGTAGEAYSETLVDDVRLRDARSAWRRRVHSLLAAYKGRTGIAARIASPDDGTITGASGNVILSPDGGSVAYIATVGGKSTLWVRRLEGRFALSLASTEGAVFPSGSPDSRSLGFFAAWKVDAN